MSRSPEPGAASPALGRSLGPGDADEDLEGSTSTSMRSSTRRRRGFHDGRDQQQPVEWERTLFDLQKMQRENKERLQESIHRESPTRSVSPLAGGGPGGSPLGGGAYRDPRAMGTTASVRRRRRAQLAAQQQQQQPPVMDRQSQPQEDMAARRLAVSPPKRSPPSHQSPTSEPRPRLPEPLVANEQSTPPGGARASPSPQPPLEKIGSGWQAGEVPPASRDGSVALETAAPTIVVSEAPAFREIPRMPLDWVEEAPQPSKQPPQPTAPLAEAAAASAPPRRTSAAVGEVLTKRQPPPRGKLPAVDSGSGAAARPLTKVNRPAHDAAAPAASASAAPIPTPPKEHSSPAAEPLEPSATGATPTAPAAAEALPSGATGSAAVSPTTPPTEETTPSAAPPHPSPASAAASSTKRVAAVLHQRAKAKSAAGGTRAAASAEVRGSPGTATTDSSDATSPRAQPVALVSAAPRTTAAKGGAQSRRRATISTPAAHAHPSALAKADGAAAANAATASAKLENSTASSHGTRSLERDYSTASSLRPRARAAAGLPRVAQMSNALTDRRRQEVLRDRQEREQQQQQEAALRAGLRSQPLTATRAAPSAGQTAAAAAAAGASSSGAALTARAHRPSVSSTTTAATKTQRAAASAHGSAGGAAVRGPPTFSLVSAQSSAQTSEPVAGRESVGRYSASALERLPSSGTSLTVNGRLMRASTGSTRRSAEPTPPQPASALSTPAKDAPGPAPAAQPRQAGRSPVVPVGDADTAVPFLPSSTVETTVPDITTAPAPAATPPTEPAASNEQSQASSSAPVPFCIECGRRHIDVSAKFCAFCGHKREFA